MSTSKSFLWFSKIVLVVVFLVIMAGAIVRMTHSGMGCPDWPKCFGKWIPPTNVSELPANYESFLKQQDIDHSFNVFHTWTEYINRLLGALLGFLLLIQFGWSIKLFWKSNRKIVWFCTVILLLTGFQAWLGKRVVDANLASVKITTHMLVALVIAALAMTIIHLLSATKQLFNKKISNITFFALIVLTVQIVFGTAVREQIDHISKELNYDAREYWIGKLDYVFYIHRSFSLLVAAIGMYVFLQFKKTGLNLLSNWFLPVCIFGEILLGIVMTYANIPAAAQPLHLLFSAVLFVALYKNWLSTVVDVNPYLGTL